MWTLLKSLLLRWGVLRLLLKVLGPVGAAVLAAIFLFQLGWPILIALFVFGSLSIVGLVMLLRWLAKRPFRPGTDPS
jgi:hypothetical protein